MTKATDHEDNWIKDQERKRAADDAAAAAQLAGHAEREAAPNKKCPMGHGALVEMTYEGVKIDRCIACNGVWLDAGELEQLTEEQGGGLFGFLTRR